MAVTELAILPLIPNVLVSSPAPVENLKRAKQVLESSSGYNFNFFQQIEDSAVLYIIGAWSSTAAHEAFLPSSQNQSLVDSVKGYIDTENILMYHLGLDAEATPLPIDAPTISINRHFIKNGQREAFQKRFEEVEVLLQDYTRPRHVAGGWRMEKEIESKEEWVLFSGFDSVEHHQGFAKTDEFQRYRSIVEYVDSFEVKHMRRLLF
jgi:quinol monooxygenase YgiN